jgi:hypothetical protein
MEEIKCNVCENDCYGEDIVFCPSCQTLVCNGCFGSQECQDCTNEQMPELVECEIEYSQVIFHIPDTNAIAHAA